MPNPEDAASSGNEDANQQAPAQDQLDRLLARMDQVDHLSARMDRMTDMFTQLMTNMALNDMRMPNIPGWPLSNCNARHPTPPPHPLMISRLARNLHFAMQ